MFGLSSSSNYLEAILRSPEISLQSTLLPLISQVYPGRKEEQALDTFLPQGTFRRDQEDYLFLRFIRNQSESYFFTGLRLDRHKFPRYAPTRRT